MLKFVGVLIAALLFSVAAHAQTTIYSYTFYCHGTFNGQDQVPGLSGVPQCLNQQSQNAAPVHGTGIEPWEPVSINIVAVDLAFWGFDTSTLTYAYAGNQFSPDIMRWYGMPNPIPAGLSFPFPASSGNPPFIDCHVSGPSGNWQLYYTIYYTKNAQ